MMSLISIYVIKISVYIDMEKKGISISLFQKLPHCQIATKHLQRKTDSLRWRISLYVLFVFHRNKSSAWTTRCSRCSAVNTCSINHTNSIHFFKSSDRMRWTMVFSIHILCAIILQLTRRSSFKSAATRPTFSFVFVVPGLPLCSVSSIDSSLAANRLCPRNTVARDTYTTVREFCDFTNF